MSKKDKEGKFVPSGHVGSGEVASVDVTMRAHVGLPTGGAAATGTSGAAQSAKYHASGYIPGTLQGATFVHPPDRLIRGRVIYKAKYLGHLKVSRPEGSAIVKDAIDKLKLVALVHNTNEPGSGSTEVDISISVRAVTCTRRGTKDIIHQHPLHLISYSADDKRASAEGAVVCYIAKKSPKSDDNICFVYETLQQQAQEVTATIGQAFELAWQRFQSTKAQTKDAVKDLKEKITDDKQKEILSKHLLLQAHEGIPAGYKQPSTINQQTGTAFEDLTPAQRKDLDDVMSQAKKVEEKETAAKLTKQASAILQWKELTEALPEPVAQQEQLSDLDKAIFDIEDQIKDLEEVFDQRQRLVVGEVGEVVEVELPASFVEEDEQSKRVMADIEQKLKEIQASNDDIDLPELPANFVMNEFVKAREQAKLPKKGSVKEAAGAWVKMTEDFYTT